MQSEYGLRLMPDGPLVEPERSPLEVADLVEHLPPGCALGRVLGGESALTNEALMGREIEFTIRAVAHSLGGGKGKQPERIPLPKPASEARVERDVMDAKARAWAARQKRATAG